MGEDLSYNLNNVNNFSTLKTLSKKGYVPGLFEIFQVGLTYDVSINDYETFRAFDISMDEYNNLDNLLENNNFITFYSYISSVISIDDAYEKFKRVIEIYPSILLRQRRNNKIEKTDFIFLEDFEIDGTEKQAWKDYRNQLRSITKNINDNEIILYDDNTFNVEWPTIPNPGLLLTNNHYLYN